MSRFAQPLPIRPLRENGFAKPQALYRCLPPAKKKKKEKKPDIPWFFLVPGTWSTRGARGSTIGGASALAAWSDPAWPAPCAWLAAGVRRGGTYLIEFFLGIGNGTCIVHQLAHNAVRTLLAWHNRFRLQATTHDRTQLCVSRHALVSTSASATTVEARRVQSIAQPDRRHLAPHLLLGSSTRITTRVARLATLRARVFFGIVRTRKSRHVVPPRSGSFRSVLCVSHGDVVPLGSHACSASLSASRPIVQWLQEKRLPRGHRLLFSFPRSWSTATTSALGWQGVSRYQR